MNGELSQTCIMITKADMIRNIVPIYEHHTLEPQETRPGIIRKFIDPGKVRFKHEIEVNIGTTLRVGDKTIRAVRDNKNKIKVVEVKENGTEVEPSTYKFERPLKPKELRTYHILVLSRHKGESIVINDNIVITVLEVRMDKVRLGITAPVEIPVHRQEVYDQILKEREKKENQSQENLPNPPK